MLLRASGGARHTFPVLCRGGSPRGGGHTGQGREGPWRTCRGRGRAGPSRDWETRCSRHLHWPSGRVWAPAEKRCKCKSQFMCGRGCGRPTIRGLMNQNSSSSLGLLKIQILRPKSELAGGASQSVKTRVVGDSAGHSERGSEDAEPHLGRAGSRWMRRRIGAVAKA